MMRTDATFCRGLGFLTIGFAAVLLLLFLLNLRAHLYYGGPNYWPLILFSLYAVVVGLGLIRLRKWAAVLFAIPRVGVGLLWTVNSLIRHQMPLDLLNVAVGLIVCLPALLPFRSWHQLR